MAEWEAAADEAEKLYMNIDNYFWSLFEWERFSDEQSLLQRVFT